jgi:hypothetical protein
MSMTLSQMKANNNPVLAGLLLGTSNDATSYVGSGLFPLLPQALSSMSIIQMGTTHLKRYNIRRAPGAPTKRIELKWGDKVVTLDQDAVEVLMPREIIRELDTARRLNVGMWLEASQIAMSTIRDVLDLSYELDCAEKAADPATYGSGMVYALSGNAKWTAATGKAVTDVRTAIEMVRQDCGRRGNRVTFSPTDYKAFCENEETRGYLPSTQLGPPTIDQIKRILSPTNPELFYVDVGDAVYEDDDGTKHDVWSGATVVSYSPPINLNTGMSLGTPRFGATSVMEGHPLAETPYYSNERKGWVYGGTYERRPNVLTQGAAFLLQNAS